MLCLHSVRLYQTSTGDSTASGLHLSLQSSNLPGDVQFSPSQRLTHSDPVHGGATRRRNATWAAPRPAECSAPSLCGAQVLFVAGPEISNHLVNICKPSKWVLQIVVTPWKVAGWRLSFDCNSLEIAFKRSIRSSFQCWRAWYCSSWTIFLQVLMYNLIISHVCVRAVFGSQFYKSNHLKKKWKSVGHQWQHN